MRRVVGLAAFCCTVLNLGIISDATAASTFNQLRIRELEKDPRIQEYLELMENEENSNNQIYDRRRNQRDIESDFGNESDNFQDESDDFVYDTPRKTKNSKRKKRTNKNRSVQNYENDSADYEMYDNQSMNESQNSRQITKKNRKRKKKKNNRAQSVQNYGNDFANYEMSDNQGMNESQNFGNNSQKNKKKRRKKNNRTRSNSKNMTNQNNQMNMMNGTQNFGNNSVDYDMSGNQMMNPSQNSVSTSKKNKQKKKSRKKRNRNRSNQTNMINQNNQMNMMNQMGQTNRINNNGFVLNEPTIDGAKIKESSIVVEKDVKLAVKDESKNIEKKISPIKSFPLDKDKVLTQTDFVKNVKLAVNLENSGKEIKEKLLQVNNSRKTYNLIRTPDKKFKSNIQTNKFREELSYYRKLYSANLKKA